MRDEFNFDFEDFEENTLERAADFKEAKADVPLDLLDDFMSGVGAEPMGVADGQRERAEV